MKRKWFVILIVTIVLCVGLYIVNLFTSNPYEKHRAKTYLHTYLITKYPDETFQIENAQFHQKTNTYTFDVMNEQTNQKTYAFEIERTSPYAVTEDSYQRALIDEPTSNRLSKEATKYLRDLLQKEIPTFSEVEAIIEVNKNALNASQKWIPSYSYENSRGDIDIFVDIDATNMNKKQVYKAVKSIQDTITNDKVNYHTIRVTAKQKLSGDSWNFVYEATVKSDQVVQIEDLVVL